MFILILGFIVIFSYTFFYEKTNDFVKYVRGLHIVQKIYKIVKIVFWSILCMTIFIRFCQTEIAAELVELFKENLNDFLEYFEPFKEKYPNLYIILMLYIMYVIIIFIHAIYKLIFDKDEEEYLNY